MSKNNLLKVEGKIIESLPNTQFIVELKDGRKVRAYSSGKMNLNHIKVLVGDEVVLELDSSVQLSNSIGRIVLRK